MNIQTTTDARALGAPASAYTYRLVDASGTQVSLPHRATARDGSSYVIDSYKPSRFQGNPGYLYTRGPRGHETLVPAHFALAIIVKEI